MISDQLARRWALSPRPVLQRRAMKHSSSRVHSALAENPALAPDVQAQLLLLSDPVVEGLLAKNPSLSPLSQEHLAVHPFELTRYSLAMNPALVYHLQETLLLDVDQVRAGLAANLSLIPSCQVALSFSRHPWTLHSLENNPTVQPNPDFALHYWRVRRPAGMPTHPALNVAGDWESLATTWPGSLAEFLLAVGLLDPTLHLAHVGVGEM